MSDVDDVAGQRDRSPAYPNIPLKTALDRLVEFEAHFKRSPARAEKIGDAWGVKGKAYIDRTIAALRYFGLLEYQGSGKERQIVLSEEGRKYLRAQQEEIKQEVIKAAALRPAQIAKFWGLWGHDRPSDAACLDDLHFKYGFSEKGARDFLRVYNETISFAKVSDSDKIALNERGEDIESEAFSVTTHVNPPSKPSAGTLPTVSAVPLRVIMNGNRLDIQASVDLEGLKKLRTMLEKYQSILEMMQPDEEEAASLI